MCRCQVEQSQASAATWQSIINVGTTMMNAFMGNKISRRASSTASSWSRASQQKEDVVRAKRAVEKLKDEIEKLDDELSGEIEALSERYDLQKLELEETQLNPRKGDMKVPLPVLLWTPWLIDDQGIAEPLFELD